MREILFRGRDLTTGKWVEGDLHRVKNGTPYIWSNGDWIFHHIDPNYIYQYTGMNYKDGRKIFEGDVVKDKLSNQYAEIIYFDDRFVLHYGEEGGFEELRTMIPYIEHFGIACEPSEWFDKEWSEENEQHD